MYVGRLSNEKGVIPLLNSFKLILSKYPKVSLGIAGSGPEEKALKILAKNLKILNKVQFLGSVKHERLPKLFQESKIFIAPSITGIVLEEAMSCECPVVAVDVDWSKEIVKNGITGYLASSDDEKERVSGTCCLHVFPIIP